MLNTKSIKIWQILLIILSVFALLKVIFIEYSLDEEYQLMMAYRALNGDSLFKEMWEPHQTSAFMCIGMMFIYKLFTGTYTGVLLFMRFLTAGIQLLISLYIYYVFKRFIKKEYAFLIAIINFNLVPKLIQIPEFGSQQAWFFTLMILPLIFYYYDDKIKVSKYSFLLVFQSGIAMALSVLSYPTTLLLFPVFLVYIGIVSGKKRWRDLAIFIGACGLCAAVWFAFVLPGLGISDFIRNFKYSISLDLTHEVDGATAGKGVAIIDTFKYIACVYLPIYAVSLLGSFIILKLKKIAIDKKVFISTGLFISIAISCLYQLCLWLVFNASYEYTQIHLMFIIVASVVAMIMLGKKEKVWGFGIVASILSIGIVVYTSDLSPYYAIPHGAFGVMLALAALVALFEEAYKEKADRLILILLIVVAITCTAGKTFTFRGGRAELNKPWDVRGIMKHGLATGVMSTYMNTYIYNSNYEDFNAYIEDGDKVLIVTNMVMSMGTSPYTFKDVDICHYSIVDPTAYDERLMLYWDLYPEKRPNVIIVDCWYGQLMENPDSYIMKYIENEFGYSQVIDGKYIRIYRK